jgi:hypothetical protein
MLDSLERAIADLRRRVLATHWLRHAALHGAVLLYAGGAAALLARALGGWERGAAAWVVAIVLAAPLSAWWLARRRAPSREAAAAWLDVRGGASGLVVTESELGSSSWSPAAEARLRGSLEALPRLDILDALRRLAPALAFAALALFVPIPRDEVGPPPAVADSALERVEEKLATLEETLELEPETAIEMEEQLERVAEESREGDAESTFEALDRLEERLEDAARDAETAALRAQHELAAATKDPSLADAQQALENALAEMAEGGLAKDLPADVQSELLPGSLALPEGMQLTSAELAKLAKSLQGALDSKLGRLAQGRLLDPKSLRKLGELPTLEGFESHECDESCLKPGGT